MGTHLDVRELPMFLLGIFLLVVLLAASYQYPSLQYNIIWMAILSLNLAIVMAFLPFSAEFQIPGWAKFGGSAAILIASIYLTFGLAEKEVHRANEELGRQVQLLGEENQALKESLKVLSDKTSDQKTANTAIAGVGEILAVAKRNFTTARQHAFGASTNTRDVDGCVNAAKLSMQSSDAALTILDTAITSVSALQKK